MTSLPIRDQQNDSLLTPKNALLIIIDYQPIQITSVASMDRRSLVANIVAAAKTAKLFGIPIVLSTVNVKNHPEEKTINQLTEVLGDIETFDRTTINAWEDREFVNAVKSYKCKKLIMAALWTEACLSFPALDALREGYEVYPLADSVGGTSLAAHETALQRMIQAGAQPISWPQLICELQRDWARQETKKTFAEILFAVGGR